MDLNTVDSMRSLSDDHIPDISIRGDENSFFRKVWCTCLGIAGFLDFAAAIADRISTRKVLAPFETAAETLDSLAKDDIDIFDYMFPDDDFFRDLIPDNEMFNAALEWLRSWAFPFSILFSLMWFIDAFVEANRRKWMAFERIDKQKLLGKEEVQQTWWTSPTTTYYRSVIVQLLFLPVGFYIFLCASTLWVQEPLILRLHYGADKSTGGSNEANEEQFSTHAGISLGLALAKYVVVSISRRTGYHFRRQLSLAIKNRIRRIIFFALRHPIRFSSRVRLGLHLLQWLKYLAPLIGALNKLKENCADLVKKYKQHREANQARRIRAKLWKELPPEEMREYAALLIQKTYRAHQARKALRALQLLQGNTHQFASLKLQRQFRRVLATARVRILQKQQEFLQLQEKQKKKRHRMDENDRRRMYRLQQELNIETTKLLNKRLLLRPNTRFAVTWKILFVSAVIFDIGQLAFKPRLDTHIDPATGKPLDFVRVLEKKFVPVPILEQEICQVVEKRRLFGLIKKKAKEPPTLQWYCQQEYVKFQGSCRWLVLFFIHRFMEIIALICFLDGTCTVKSRV